MRHWVSFHKCEIDSKAIEVVDITDEKSVAVNVSYKLELKGIPKPQARPRLGRNGFFTPPETRT